MNSIIVQITETKNSAFVIMPFSGEFNELKLLINDAANQAGLTEYRVDKNPEPGISIRDDIIQGIREAKIVVAICSPENDTGRINSNVVYELGYAHSIGKGVLILTTTIDSIPFNPQDKNDVLIYDPRNIKRGRDGLVLLIKDKMKTILNRVKNGLTDSGYKDITAQPSSSMPPVIKLYFDLLGFAKLVHHHFHELDQEGCHEIDIAARTLFHSKSKGNQPELIINCQDGWYNCVDSRDEIQKNVFKEYEKLVGGVNDTFDKLMTNTGNDEDDAKYRITSSSKSFREIKKSLESYKLQIEAVSRHFNPDGSLDIINIKRFEQDAMGLARTVGRLINRADSMIKNIIEALEVDSRLGLEQEHE